MHFSKNNNVAFCDTRELLVPLQAALQKHILCSEILLKARDICMRQSLCKHSSRLQWLLLWNKLSEPLALSHHTHRQMCEHSPQRVSSNVNRCSNLQHSGGTTPLTGLAAPLLSALSWESGDDRPWGGLHCTPLKRKQSFSRKIVLFQNVFSSQI